MDNRTITAINSLRENIDDLAGNEKRLQDDIYLLLWLKAKKMSIPKAEAAIREAFKFYGDRDFDAEQKLVSKKLMETMPIFVDGVARDGLPVCYVRPNALRIHQLLKDFTIEDLNRFAMSVTLRGEENMMNLIRKKYESEGEKALESARAYVVILDAYGYSFKDLPPLRAIQMFIGMSLEAIKFPATARTAYFIGANRIFLSVLRPIAPVMNRLGVTLKVFGTDEESWQDELYQIIRPDQLEAFRRRVDVIESQRKM